MSLRSRALTAITTVSKRVPRLRNALDTILGRPQRRNVILSGGPPKAVFHQPSVRSYVDWTPAMIRTAEIAAEAGSLCQAAMLCEEMLADDRIQGCLQEVRVRGLLGLDLSFEPGLGKGRGKAIRYLEAEEDWDVALPDYALCELFTWGILLGLGLGWNDWQLLERLGKNKRQIPILQNYHAQHLSHDSATGKWYAAQLDGTKREVVPGDGLWVMHAPYGMNRPWARGSWRALSRWWLLKVFARSDWGRYSERHGMGLFAGVAPDGANPKDREALAADLAAMARDCELVLPPGYDLKLVESTANTWTTFRAQIEMANLAIAINVLGQNLSTEVQGGSYAAAKAQIAVKNSILKADGWSASTTLHDQSLAFWAQYNFDGNRKIAPWPIWDTELPEDLAAKAETLNTAGQALKSWQDAGVNVDKEKFAEDFNVAVSEQEPEPPAAPPQKPEEGPEGTPPEDGEPPAEPPEGEAPAPIGRARLASGDSPAKAKGFIKGQTYADDLAASTRDHAAAALSPWIDDIQEIIENAESLEGLRAALLDAYPSMPAEDFENLIARALVLAECGGNLAVLEDA